MRVRELLTKYCKVFSKPEPGKKTTLACKERIGFTARAVSLKKSLAGLEGWQPSVNKAGVFRDYLNKGQLEMVITRSSDRMNNIMESLILAQNERWRRVLSMQVERQGELAPPRAADW